MKERRKTEYGGKSAYRWDKTAAAREGEIALAAPFYPFMRPSLMKTFLKRPGFGLQVMRVDVPICPEVHALSAPVAATCVATCLHSESEKLVNSHVPPTEQRFALVEPPCSPRMHCPTVKLVVLMTLPVHPGLLKITDVPA